MCHAWCCLSYGAPYTLFFAAACAFCHVVLFILYPVLKLLVFLVCAIVLVLPVL
jgi:prepilin signal peptidase PulO-like enzyme (type II secretory pathway)